MRVTRDTQHSLALHSRDGHFEHLSQIVRI